MSVLSQEEPFLTCLDPIKNKIQTKTKKPQRNHQTTPQNLNTNHNNSASVVLNGYLKGALQKSPLAKQEKEVRNFSHFLTLLSLSLGQG